MTYILHGKHTKDLLFLRKLGKILGKNVGSGIKET